MRLFTAVVLTLACATAGAENRSAGFPTFEPFTASRMWKVSYGEPGTLQDPDAVTAAIGEMLKQLETLSDEERSSPLDTGQSALDSTVTLRERLIWFTLPWVMMQLEPLWDSTQWTDSQIDLANGAVALVRVVAPGTDIEFAAGGENGPGLRALAAWFEASVRRPEAYGYMIATMDDGPWRGLEYTPNEPLVAVDERAITPEFSLRLCKVPEGFWCLQGVTGEQVSWTRVLAEVPTGEFSFGKTPATSLGQHGWKIHMTFGEYVHLYLDAGYRPLFYFTSW